MQDVPTVLDRAGLVTRRALALLTVLTAAHGLAVAQVPGRYAALTATSRDVAARYFEAYINRRWDQLEPLLADTATFRDPTAAHVFGSQQHQGKPAVMRLFREGYSSITSMEFRPLRVFSAGEYTVLSGDLSWTVKLADGRLVSTVMPISTSVRVEGGLITEHVDMADYQPYLDAMARARR